MTSPLVLWCRSIFEGDFAEPIKPMSMTVSLMNENKVPVRVWSFSNAYPVNWDVENFNSTKNEVAIEKIELSYNTSSRMI
jgi:phage tail-like protein